MSGLMIGGVEESGPSGIRVLNWVDDPSMCLDPADYRLRETAWVRSVVVHATVGDEPQIVRPGRGPVGMAKRTVKAWAGDSRHAGSHLLIDGDGTVWCVADLLLDATYHAQSINEVSIGIEVCQTAELEIWEAQLDALFQVAVPGLVDWLTRRFRIQRQGHWPYLGDSLAVPRLAAGGRDCVGVFGHRDQTTDRGRGDPGDAVPARASACGYERWDFSVGADKLAWSERQASLGVVVDGVPGPATAQALLEHTGRALWVPRPGDDA